MTVTLLKGQFKIGDLVFGTNTNIIVTNFDVQPYDINVQDYQVVRSDSMRFGYDNFKPTSINISMEVIYNWKIPPYDTLPGASSFWSEKPTVETLSQIWRADNVRTSWGVVMPLYFCGKSGITKMVLGRPGQFTAEKVSTNSTIVKCMGEFRRADTLVYSAVDDPNDLENASVWTSVD